MLDSFCVDESSVDKSNIICVDLMTTSPQLSPTHKSPYISMIEYFWDNVTPHF